MAREVFTFAGIIGAIIFVCAIVMALGGLLSANDAFGRHTPVSAYVLAATPGIAGVVLGIIMVVLAMIGHTSVVSAEIAAAMLKIAEGEDKTSR